MANPTWPATTFSSERWNTYMAASDGNFDLALALYDWNLNLAAALIKDIGYFEVALRNIFDTQLRASFGPEWMLDPESPVRAPLMRTRSGRRIDANHPNRANLDRALRHAGQRATHGQQVAALSFGFWRHLTDSAYESRLWVPILSRSFSPPPARATLGTDLKLIHTLRNRAAHHESFITQRRLNDIHSGHAALTRNAHLINPYLAQQIEERSMVLQLLTHPPTTNILTQPNTTTSKQATHK